MGKNKYQSRPSYQVPPAVDVTPTPDPVITPDPIPPTVPEQITESQAIAHLQTMFATLSDAGKATLAAVLAPAIPHITVLGSGKVTKKSVVLDLLADRANYPGGITLDELATHPRMIAIDSDVRVNRTTCQLWLSKIGVPVTRIKTGSVSRYLSTPVASATGTDSK